MENIDEKSSKTSSGSPALYILKHVSGSMALFSILFICAWRLNYWQGWAYVVTGLLMSLLSYTLLKPDAELLAERSKPAPGAKKWDKSVLAISFLFTLAMFVTAGLDSGRHKWSPELPLWTFIPGIILTASGQLLFLIAQKQNRFFSSTARIQSDRGHVVCDTGLYKTVRHPAYMGSVIQALGFPLIMGSVWSIVPVALLIITTLVRTLKEDKMLKAELAGYIEYSEKTHSMIIPFIW